MLWIDRMELVSLLLFLIAGDNLSLVLYVLPIVSGIVAILK